MKSSRACPLPAAIPEGNPSVPGFVDVVAIATDPDHGRGGDRDQRHPADQRRRPLGTLAHTTSNASPVVLMNHNSPNTVGTFGFVYDDGGNVAPATVARPVLHPGAVRRAGQPAVVPRAEWSRACGCCHVANSVEPFTGSVQGLNMLIQPQVSLTTGITNTLAAQKWAYYSVDVPAGATNLTISATNLTTATAPLPLDVFVKLGAQPTTNNFDKMMVVPTTPPPPPPGSSLSIGPTDVPPLQPGRYWVGVFNPNPIGSAAADLLALRDDPAAPSGRDDHGLCRHGRRRRCWTTR